MMNLKSLNEKYLLSNDYNNLADINLKHDYQ